MQQKRKNCTLYSPSERSLSGRLCCCRDENPRSLPREKRGVAYTLTSSCAAASRTGGEQRRLKYLPLHVYNYCFNIAALERRTKQAESFWQVLRFILLRCNKLHYSSIRCLNSLLHILSMHHNHWLTSYFILYMIYAIHFEHSLVNLNTKYF